MRGDILLKVLETLGRGARTTVDLFDVFISAGYGVSASRLDYLLRQKSKKRAEQEKILRLRQSYYSMVFRLRRDGLAKTESKKNKILSLTAKGLEKLKKLRQANVLPRVPKADKSNAFLIVAFDVPEKERRKRAWLRNALKHMGLFMVQKSVWMGKVKLPKEFLDSLYKLRLSEFVEIFEITKAGTLEHIT